jgi:histidine triad (HIT) family protein
MDCIFCKIAIRELDTPLLYQNDEVVAFADIAPKAPIHILIIPRHHIATVNDLSMNEFSIIGKMHSVACQLAKDIGIADDGYRLVMNCNQNGGQTVPHIHLHLLGGRKMSWPPG